MHLSSNSLPFSANNNENNIIIIIIINVILLFPKYILLFVLNTNDTKRDIMITLNLDWINLVIKQVHTLVATSLIKSQVSI